MLHAFNSKTGKEEWAFVPPFVASSMPNMVNVNLNRSGVGGSNAIYGVDGSPTVKDIYFDDNSKGLSKMSIDIIKVIIRKLASQGETFSMSIFRSLKATYYREALDFVQIYKKDALMNAYDIDVHEEETAVELFAKNIMVAGQVFLDSPMESPNIPTWSRVDTAFPNFLNDLKKAVELDNKL